VAHQRPSLERDEAGQKRAHAADEAADEDGLHHVFVLKWRENRVDHLSSSFSARFSRTSSRPARLLYSRWPSFPNTRGRSSSVSRVSALASCFCTVDSSKRKCRSTPPNAFAMLA